MLRLVIPDDRYEGELYYLEWNRDLHHTPMLPNAQVIHSGIAVTTNSLGLRDREFALKKTDNVFRILLVGDSFTFGQGVPLKLTLPKQLESKLNDLLTDSVEVVNFGVCGFNTFQEMMYVTRHGLALNPDMILPVWVHHDHDLNGYSYSDFEQFILNGTVTVSDSADELDVDIGLDMKQVIYDIYSFLDRNFYTVKVFGGRMRYLLMECGVNLHVWEQTTDFLEDEEGIKLSYASLKHLSELCAKKGIEFGVVIYPYLQLLNDDHYDNLVYRQVESFCTDNDIRCLNLFPHFKGLNQFRLHVNMIDSHPNGKAHSIAADAVVDYFTQISQKTTK